MKKYSFILIAACAMGLAACSVTPELIITPEAETITFSASIDLPAATRAALDDHDVVWLDGDVIGVANDQNDDIEACAITVDVGDPTLCTFTATAVPGATTYYAICKGNNITGITFNHSTATFGGLSNSQTEFGKLTLFADHVTMAAKSTDQASFSFSPCLAIVRLQIAAESVAAKYAGGYSGVRGVNIIIKHSGSRIISAGNYTVDLSGEMSVAYVDDEAKKNFLQISEGSSLMTAGADYYMSVIPAGPVETFQLQFFGFDSGENATWSDIYPMSLTSTTSMDPGDMFNFGTLNPVGLQKARDSFVPAITLDGDMSDWASVDMFPLDGEKDAFDGEGANMIYNWKATSDSKNIYFYFKVNKNQIISDGAWGAFIATALDTDNNAGTGNSANYSLGDGYEAEALCFPLSNPSPVTFYDPASPTSSSWIKCPAGGSQVGTVSSSGCIDEDYGYVEMCIPRNKIGSPASSTTIRVRSGYGWGARCDAQTIVLE